MKIINWKDSINELELNDINNCLKNGGHIIFPTETVYGIGAMATSNDAVLKIFDIKGRAGDNPLIVHLSNVDEINKYAYISNNIEKKLINNFMPGPFTLILKKKDIIPNSVSANLDTVGIRIPSNYIANKILSYENIPIAAPSANLSGKPSGTSVSNIIDDFKDKVDYIIDGGDSLIGLESTVVKVIDNIPVILRPGYITKEDILSVIGIVRVDNNVFKKDVKKAISPGMKYRHYAPKSKCRLIYFEDKNELLDYFIKNTNSDTVIIGSSILKSINCKKYLYYGDKLTDIAHNIFSLLREADLYNPKIILIEGVEYDGLGLAIMNRLLRSCSYDYISR